MLCLLETTTPKVLTTASAEGPPFKYVATGNLRYQVYYKLIQTSTYSAAGQANLPLLDAGSAGLRRRLPRSTMPPFRRCSPAGGLQTELPSPPPSLLAGPHPSRFPAPRSGHAMQYELESSIEHQITHVQLESFYPLSTLDGAHARKCTRLPLPT